MAFDDFPQIDRASVNDDRAKNRMKSLFSQEYGFIAREQVPDKGCDFKVELISGSSAVNRNFDVQLKSVELPVPVNGGTYLSFSFNTSRFGYMMNTQPICGLFVLYDVDSGTCYFEFVDKLYCRLAKERNSDDWKKNQAVNVHIPMANILDEAALVHIHAVSPNVSVDCWK